MALLSEYALTPDVFDTASYAHEEVAEARLDTIKEALLNEALVRDLQDGDWSGLFLSDNRAWHRRGKELLKKLKTNGRLRTFPPSLTTLPASDCEWCKEALETHEITPLDGIVVTRGVYEKIGRNILVSRVDRLSSAPWWSGRSPSVRLVRNKTDYEKHLRLLLSCANSISLIDAHFDPSEERFQDFVQILSTMSSRPLKPLIEIHRVCYVGSGRSRDVIDDSTWEDRFKRSMADLMLGAGLTANVHIWDDFHDRHIITDLMGIKLNNSLDTSRRPNDITTWARVGRKDRDDIQREFDPASGMHRLLHRFSLP